MNSRPKDSPVDNLLSDCVVTTSIVVGSILLSTDDLLGVIKLAECSTSDLVTHGWFKINVDSTGNVLARSRFTEEGAVGIINSTAGGLGRSHCTVGVDAMLQAVQLPAAVTSLDTSLAEMN